MSDLVRLSFSIEKPLADRFEKLVEESRYANRSEFIRDMIRNQLVNKEWQEGREVVGTITLIYNHETRALGHKLTGLQHKHHSATMATTHIHLDEHLCAEMIMVKGLSEDIKELADMLRQQKGVLHAAFTLSSTGLELK